MSFVHSTSFSQKKKQKSTNFFFSWFPFNWIWQTNVQIHKYGCRDDSVDRFKCEWHSFEQAFLNLSNILNYAKIIQTMWNGKNVNFTENYLICLPILQLWQLAVWKQKHILGEKMSFESSFFMNTLEQGKRIQHIKCMYEKNVNDLMSVVHCVREKLAIAQMVTKDQQKK